MEELMQYQQIEEIEEFFALFERRMIRDRSDPFRQLNDAAFIRRYRLSKEGLRNLFLQIQNGSYKFPTAVNNRGCSVPPHLQFLVGVRYMATGNFQISMGDCSDMSTTSVCRFLARTSIAISSLKSEYIKFPTSNQSIPIIQKFKEIAGMPGVIGCIDGTHVPIRSPGGEQSELYRCRKGFYSINVQIICNADLIISNVISSWPGSVHDSRIFDNSLVCNYLEQGNHIGYLLADNGYPCRKSILTPVLNPQSDKERRYNTCHIKTRNTVERAIGVLKRRFACLGIPLRTKITNTHKIIMACAVLHNIAITQKTPLIEDGLMPEQDENGEIGPLMNNTPEGFHMRNSVIERWF